MRVAKKATEHLDIELDLGRYELHRFGRRVKLETKPMELLIFLVGRRDQLVSREDIVKKLWRSNLFIDTERNLNNIVRKIRTALGDNTSKPRFLETVVGKGYRFIGPMRVIEAQFPQSVGPTSAPGRSFGRANDRVELTSLAVLPLTLVGKISDDQALCLGFADALVARLANLHGVNVLPTSAVLNVPADATPADIASRLGVRFVVHGAIQSLKGQWRLSLEMFDTHQQGPCLTKKCDLDMGRLAETEIDIAKQIAAALKRPLGPALVQQRPRYSRDPLAYAEYMRGYRLTASGDPATMEESIQYLTNAVTRDPAFALAHATLSLACATRHFEYDPASMWLEKQSFIAAARWKLTRTYRKAMWPALSCCGDHQKTFSIWKPSRA